MLAFQLGKDLLTSAASWPLPFSAGVQELDNLTTRIIVEIFCYFTLKLYIKMRWLGSISELQSTNVISLGWFIRIDGNCAHCFCVWICK